MLIADVPQPPVQDAPVAAVYETDMRRNALRLLPTRAALAARGNPSKGVSANPNRVVGVCIAIVGPEGSYREEGLYPVSDADNYMYRFEHRANYFSVGSMTQVLQQPKHGKLVLLEKTVPNFSDKYKYYPDKGFDGYDTFAIDVEKDGITVQVRYRVEVSSGGDSKSLCPGGREFWKISLLDAQTIEGL